ncbi:MAG: hypothetical protein LAO31_23215 [Acidobacteriia bacterium]|nr:hypothetical protein [Terriglobia bacterium]
MTLEKLFLLSTLLIILVNFVGWEGLRRYFRLARGKASSPRDLLFVRTLLPWVVRVEFFYYLFLAAFAIVRPRTIPVAIVFFLVIYHAAGLVLSEKYAPHNQQDTPRFNVQRPSSRIQLTSLRIISFLDGFEMAFLLYFCLILRQRM